MRTRYISRCYLLVFLLVVQSATVVAQQKHERPVWPPATGVISSLEMFQPRYLKKIAPLRIDGIQWGTAIYPGDLGTDKARRLPHLISRVHARGAKYIGSINGGGFYHRTMNSEAIIHFDGSLRHRHDSKAKIYKCWFRPKMYAAFVETAKRCVDLEMDGFVLDDWSASNQLCFCDACIPLYRQYLRQHKDDLTVKRILGDVDIETFDYGQFLRDRQTDPSLPDWKYPLGWQLKHYRRDRLLEQVSIFWKTIRRYADDHSHRPFYLTANVSSIPWMAFSVRNRLDYFLVEVAYFQVYGGYPPKASSISLHKKTRMAGKRGVLQPANVDTIRQLITLQSVATLRKIWVAEAYASGNLFTYLPREHGGVQIDGDNGLRILDLPLRELQPYYTFFQKHPDIYTNTTSLAGVAVLYHMTEAVDKEFQAICKLLYETHNQFDAILIGDGTWDTTVPTAEALAKYKVVFVPLAKTPLPEAAIRELARYRQAGGLVVSSTEFTDFHQSKQANKFTGYWQQTADQNSAPRNLRSFTPYLQTQKAATREDVKSLVEPADSLFQTNAPWTVGIQCWQTGSRTILHLVNYDYDQKTDQVEEARNISIRVCASARTARWLSPDDGTDKPLRFKKQGDSVVLTLPRLHVYAILVLEK